MTPAEHIALDAWRIASLAQVEASSARPIVKDIARTVLTAPVIRRPVIPRRADSAKPMRDRTATESATAAVAPSGAGGAGGKGPPPEKTGAPPTGPRPQRPVIQLAGGKLPATVDKAEGALIDAKPEFYRYGGQLVRPVVEEVPAADMSSTKVHRLVPVSRPYLIEAFTKVAQWQKFDRRSRTWIDIDCPTQAAETYLAREGEWRLQPLAGITSAPMLRADGSLLDRPGYDERTGLLFRSDGTKFEPVPNRPTRGDAERAMVLLEDLIKTFPFVGAADRSVAISAILSVLDRRAVEAAPMHAFSSPVAGSGKSMLVDVCSMIATGHRAPVLDQSKDDVETDKRLVAALLRGGAIISIDNVDRPLDSALLCQALTSSGVMQLRVLGSSRDVDVPNTAMFFATGNNLAIAGDLTRRTVVCRLDPGVERPELREFSCDPPSMVREDRAAYVRAALTILRGYILAEDRATVAPLGSYEGWSRRVREAIIWLGRADPCETMATARRADPISSQLASVLTAWRSSVGVNTPITGQALVAMAGRVDLDGTHTYADLRETLVAVAGDDRGGINTGRLGKWLSKNENRVIDRHKIARASVQTSVARWLIVQTDGVG